MEMEGLDLAAARTLDTDEQALLASSGQQGVKPCLPRRALRARVYWPLGK